MKQQTIGKHFTTVFAAILIVFVAQAQVKTKGFQKGIPDNLVPFKAATKPIKVIAEPADFGKVPEESPTEYKGRKFASRAVVDIDAISEATKVEQKGDAYYLLAIRSKKALNISFRFKSFRLSPGAVLNIYTQHELTDSITAAENTESGIWATRVYQGNELNLVLKVPLSEVGQSILKIDEVYLGFKQFGINYFGNPGVSAPCNVNVVCPAGTGWENERNSVALIVAGGEESCTGALIMNTCGTNIPYFLTADHCLAAGGVNNWVFQFQYWSTDCARSGLINGV